MKQAERKEKQQVRRTQSEYQREPEYLRENGEEYWEAYWRDKQQRQKRIKGNYICLIAMTVLFGVLTIGLRLDLRFGWLQNLGLKLRWDSLRVKDSGSILNNTAEWSQAQSAVPKALRNPRPTAPQLRELLGLILVDEQLQLWGEQQNVTGGSAVNEMKEQEKQLTNGELELLYFPAAQVYLLRQRSEQRIVYADKFSP